MKTPVHRGFSCFAERARVAISPAGHTCRTSHRTGRYRERVETESIAALRHLLEKHVNAWEPATDREAQLLRETVASRIYAATAGEEVVLVTGHMVSPPDANQQAEVAVFTAEHVIVATSYLDGRVDVAVRDRRALTDVRIDEAPTVISPIEDRVADSDEGDTAFSLTYPWGEISVHSDSGTEVQRRKWLKGFLGDLSRDDR
jgi:hypothetical protein